MPVNANLIARARFCTAGQASRPTRVGDAMPNEETDDISRDAEKYRLKRQAQAVLDLFERAHGRMPATMDEIREWMGSQDQDLLHSMMNRRLEPALSE